MSAGGKVCKGCGQHKPLEAFYRCAAVKDGRAARCKSCRDQAHRVYYEANAEKLRADGRAARRKWSAENPERQREQNRRTRNTPAGKAADARKRKQHQTAGKPWGGALWERDRLVVLEREDGVCGICNEDVDPLDFTLDHIVPTSRGGLHTLDNLQLAHRSCNSRKHAREEVPA